MMTHGFLKTVVLAAWVGVFLPAAAAQPEWRFLRDNQVRSLTCEGRADTPDGPAQARMELFCREGKGGWIGLTFTVYRTDAPPGSDFPAGAKGFHYDDFEGPDAPAQKRRLTQLAVRGDRAEAVSVAQSGSYSASLPGFQFTAGALNTGGNPVKRLLRSVTAKAQALTIRVQDSQDPKAGLQAEFPAAGLSGLIDQLLQGY